MKCPDACDCPVCRRREAAALAELPHGDDPRWVPAAEWFAVWAAWNAKWKVRGTDDRAD